MSIATRDRQVAYTITVRAEIAEAERLTAERDALAAQVAALAGPTGKESE